MEDEKKLNYVSNGVTKLPPGFQFEPTDEEIVFEYLKCKVLGLHLPAVVIPEINVFEYDPWNLPGEMEKNKYFFCSKKINVMSSKLANCSGYWKFTGEARLILSSTSTEHNDRFIGLRKTLTFYNGNMSSIESKSLITEWKMHEYHMIILSHSSSANSKSMIKKSSLALGGWSICNILKMTKNRSYALSSSYASMNRNKRTRNDTDTDSTDSTDSSDELGLFKSLSKLDDDDNGGKSCSSSASSCCSWSSGSSSISTVKCSSDDDTEESSSSRSSNGHVNSASML